MQAVWIRFEEMDQVCNSAVTFCPKATAPSPASRPRVRRLSHRAPLGAVPGAVPIHGGHVPARAYALSGTTLAAWPAQILVVRLLRRIGRQAHRLPDAVGVGQQRPTVRRAARRRSRSTRRGAEQAAWLWYCMHAGRQIRRRRSPGREFDA